MGYCACCACQIFGMEGGVFMVKLNFDQKPYRKIMINTFGGTVNSSPSEVTDFGRRMLNADKHSTGSLGIAISEAIERASADPTRTIHLVY